MAFHGNAQESWSLKMVVPLEPGIVCIDIDRMFEFYTGALGLTLVSDAETTPEWVHERQGFACLTFVIAHMK
jgi:hypothetical protein